MFLATVWFPCSISILKAKDNFWRGRTAQILLVDTKWGFLYALYVAEYSIFHLWEKEKIEKEKTHIIIHDDDMIYDDVMWWSGIDV